MIFDNDDNITIPGIIMMMMMMKMNEKMKTRYQVEKINQIEYDEKKMEHKHTNSFLPETFFFILLLLLWNTLYYGMNELNLQNFFFYLSHCMVSPKLNQSRNYSNQKKNNVKTM